jgi:quercetin dioxygenase-like cupin family protein
MKIAKISDMMKGWFIGDFTPTLWKTKDVEVAFKVYKAGDAEPAHYHKIATEFTVITAGIVVMNGVQYKTGDIVVIEPGEVTDFKAITDVTTTVVKIPGATNDKYEAEQC